MSRLAVITGASSGIGRELARVHAEHGGNLVIVARREDRLASLADELREENGVTVYALARDLSEPGAAAALVADLDRAELEPEILVNNAGFGGRGAFADQDLARNARMVRLNVTALMELTGHLLPRMLRAGRGHVLNVGSTAGMVPGPFQAVYFATKAFVNSFSEALAEEVRGSGVTVTVLCPGPTASEFAATAGMADAPGFQGKVPGSREVAEYGYRAMLEGRDLVVHGAQMKLLMHGALRALPRRAVVKLVRRSQQ
jgi:short-subunit dehydrogenase